MRPPGSAEIFLNFKDKEALAGRLVLHVPCSANARNTRADNKHVEMFRSLGSG